MTPIDALFESWNRQCQIVNSLAAIITPELAELRPNQGEWNIRGHLAHISDTRRWWLSRVSPEHFERTVSSHVQVAEDDWQPIEDIDKIKENIEISGRVVLEAVQDLLAKNVQSVGGYDHPLLFLQHMLWHDGWHVGIIMLALRANGHEPAEEWEEANIWGRWRVE